MQTLIAWIHHLFHTKAKPAQAKRADKSRLSIVKSHNSSTKNDASSKLATPKAPTPSQSNTYQGNLVDLPAHVDTYFFKWMVAQPTQSAIRSDSAQMAAIDQRLVEYLDTVAASESAGSSLIPRVPSVMLELLKRMHEENVSGSELSALIARDVVLVAAILNEVNSSFYQLSKRVTDLSQAIMLLGHNRLRMVLAKVSFTPIYSNRLGPYTQHRAEKIWEHSQKRALACYLLAKHQQVDPFMAFLAGLMADVGFMVALRVFDRGCDARFEGQLPNSSTFKNMLQKKSLILSARISAIWTMPEVVIKAIEGQGLDKLTRAKLPLAKVLNRANLLSKLCILIQAGKLNVDMDKMREILSEAEMDCLSVLVDGRATLASVV